MIFLKVFDVLNKMLEDRATAAANKSKILLMLAHHIKTAKEIDLRLDDCWGESCADWIRVISPFRSFTSIFNLIFCCFNSAT
jgi:hypothetical protein